MSKISKAQSKEKRGIRLIKFKNIVNSSKNKIKAKLFEAQIHQIIFSGTNLKILQKYQTIRSSIQIRSLGI